MREDLGQIDTSAVDELYRLKEEQELLRQRLDGMADRKVAVSPEVFERVRRDYEERYERLEESARPLKTRARSEYAKLRGILERIGTSAQEAKLAVEELDFRHSLGEFDDEEHQRRLEEANERVAASEGELAEATALKERFVSAFHSEEELLASIPPPRLRRFGDDDEATDRSESGPFEADEPPGDTTEDRFERESEGGRGLGASEGAADIGGDVEEDRQGGEDFEATVDPRDLGGAMSAPRSPAPVPSSSAHSTAALAVGALLLVGDQGEIEEEHPLELGTTTIGRSPRNDVCIRESSVSRQHAKIVFTERGFVIYDLGSENGVFVNGERITQRQLSEEDVIEFGPGIRSYVFRGPRS